MKLALGLAAFLMLTAGTMEAQSGHSVLFIGNSFTYGAGSPVRFYRSSTVTDLNNEGIGGVPALFKSFSQQAGLDFDVYLETEGGDRPRLPSREQARRHRPARMEHGGDARVQHARRHEAS